jgi:2-polyprenyl-3-methyl-5-hydroxy-6-metoxy-1,4-benzoquinol methylase
MTRPTGAVPLRCRLCETPLRHTFADLGSSPLCQTHVAPAQLSEPETFYPLHAMVCERCFLVQLPAFVPPAELFGEYAYFSSYADALVRQAGEYCDAMTQRLGLGRSSRVIEVASNDGYLLQHFVARGVPCLGIEPAANVARAARERGVPTEVAFVGVDSAARIVAAHGRADLLIGNNVLAHVPDLHDFVGGLATLLAPAGTLTMEFPHVQRLIEARLFDTIYHEHFSYLGLGTARRAFAAHAMTVVDVEEVDSHGGSYRIHVAHEATGRAVSPRVAQVLARERDAGLERLETYTGFGEGVARAKRDILSFLITARSAGKRVAGYGAPGKGNTLLNYCGIRTDFLDFTVDRNPYKQGKYTPGTRIPILAPEAIREHRPDYVFVLPWNLKDEIVGQMGYVREWGGRFVVPLPRLEVIG